MSAVAAPAVVPPGAMAPPGGSLCLHVPQPDGSVLVFAPVYRYFPQRAAACAPPECAVPVATQAQAAPLKAFSQKDKPRSRGHDPARHNMPAPAPTVAPAPSPAPEAAALEGSGDLFVPQQLDLDTERSTPVPDASAAAAADEHDDAAATSVNTDFVSPAPAVDTSAPATLSADKPTLCKFYLEGTCRHGLKCPFRCVAADTEDDSLTPVPSHPSHVQQLPTGITSLPGHAVCKYFLIPAGCRAGAACGQAHVVDGQGRGVLADGCCRVGGRRRGKR